LKKSYMDLLKTAHFTSSNANIIPAWHGAGSHKKLMSVCWYGLMNLSTTDDGWFGKGIYLTQAPHYGEFYARTNNHHELLMCWVILGKPKPITNKILGAPCTEGYTSHYVVVDENYCPEQSVDNVKGKRDEIVVFNKAHVLPYCIVKYSSE